MRQSMLSGLIMVLACGYYAPVNADSKSPIWRETNQGFSIAVYGDSPYGCKSGECPLGFFPDSKDGPNPGDPRQLEATPTFIKSINDDRAVSLVLHVGDIHSGSQYCTLAYNQMVKDLWKDFKDPLVYTPGDNEWADCHKSKEGGNVKDTQGNYVNYANGNPVANLALVRSMFFPNPGETLGVNKLKVVSQALSHDPAFPKDAEYVENVLFEKSGVLFVTLNIPGGSNNDSDTWFGAATKTGEQIQEIAQRTDADLRWLNAAFEKAKSGKVKALVIVLQADMWDLDGTKPADQHLANYEPFIKEIADNAVGLAKPVLLLNGDSHNYRSDNPLKQSAGCVIESGAAITPCTDNAWDNHPSYDVSNFHRIVVHGSYFPLEYLRLKYDAKANYSPTDNAFGPFSWERVAP